MGGGMDSFIVIVMLTTKRVVSFDSNHTAALPFGSQRVSFGVEVDTDDAVPFAFGRSLRFAEYHLSPPPVRGPLEFSEHTVVSPPTSLSVPRCGPRTLPTDVSCTEVLELKIGRASCRERG